MLPLDFRKVVIFLLILIFIGFALIMFFGCTPCPAKEKCMFHSKVECPHCGEKMGVISWTSIDYESPRIRARLIRCISCDRYHIMKEWTDSKGAIIHREKFFQKSQLTIGV
jgi:hypothetical protein